MTELHAQPNYVRDDVPVLAFIDRNCIHHFRRYQKETPGGFSLLRQCGSTGWLSAILRRPECFRHLGKPPCRPQPGGVSQTTCQPAGLAPPMRRRHGAVTMFSALAVLSSTVSAMDTVPWPRRLLGRVRLSWSSPTKLPC